MKKRWLDANYLMLLVALSIALIPTRVHADFQEGLAAYEAQNFTAAIEA